MNIVALQEGLNQVLVFAEVRHDAQLDLAVIGAEEKLSGIRYERLAHLFSLGIANGDVLQIGVRRRQTTRCRNSLIE